MLFGKLKYFAGFHGYEFYGGLYKVQAYDVYYGVGEYQSPGCHYKVTGNWNMLCYTYFRE
jgi:hypothetical protein